MLLEGSVSFGSFRGGWGGGGKGNGGGEKEEGNAGSYSFLNILEGLEKGWVELVLGCCLGIQVEWRGLKFQVPRSSSSTGEARGRPVGGSGMAGCRDRMCNSHRDVACGRALPSGRVFVLDFVERRGSLKIYITLLSS